MIFSLNRLNIVCLIVLIPLSIATGIADFDWSTALVDAEQTRVMLVSRIPRTLAVLLVGATLAIAGMVLQIVLKNRFIEPNMIGATQSASIGILLATLLFPSAMLLVKMSIATASALIGIGLFALLLQRLPPQQQLMVPLIGVIFGNIVDALGTFIAYETDSMQLLSVWRMGDFSGVLVGRYELLWLTAFLTLIIYLIADQLSIVGLGKEISINLGIPYQKMMWLALIAVAMITSVVVITVGQIPFLGLVVPNIVSRLAGDRLRKNLPSVVLLGANLALACDILGRTINMPYEIPISTIFGVLGTLLFLYLLFKEQRKIKEKKNAN